MTIGEKVIAVLLGVSAALNVAGHIAKRRQHEELMGVFNNLEFKVIERVSKVQGA